jgi:hypothetical protein
MFFLHNLIFCKSVLISQIQIENLKIPMNVFLNLKPEFKPILNKNIMYFLKVLHQFLVIRQRHQNDAIF